MFSAVLRVRTMSRMLDTVTVQNGLAGNSQYLTLHSSDDTLGRGQDGLQKGREAAVLIGALKPGSDAVGVMLVTSAALACKSTAP
jgi:hypothetical protein